MSKREEGGVAGGADLRDPEVLTALFERHADRLYRLAARLLHDDGEAEDVVQETFLQALDRAASFEGRSDAGTWLYRVAYNRSLDRLRARRRKGERAWAEAPEQEEGGVPFPSSLVDWSAAADRATLDGEARAVLNAAIAALAEPLRATFLLRDVEGFSTAETAAALAISEGAAKVRLHRARLQLRERLADYFGERAP